MMRHCWKPHSKVSQNSRYDIFPSKGWLHSRSPQISLQYPSTDLMQPPEPVCTVCRINLLIGLSNSLTESPVLGGSASSTVLLEGQMVPTASAKREGKGQNCPFHLKWVVKLPLLDPFTGRSAYTQHSSRICRHTQIPAWFEQGKVCETFRLIHTCTVAFSLLRSLFFCEWQIMNTQAQRSSILPTLYSLLRGSISFIFLRQA